MISCFLYVNMLELLVLRILDSSVQRSPDISAVSDVCDSLSDPKYLLVYGVITLGHLRDMGV